jgi:hypothetical protein
LIPLSEGVGDDLSAAALAPVRGTDDNALMEATPPEQPGPYGQPPAQPGYGQQPGPGGQPGYGQPPYPQVPPGGGKLDTADTFDRIFKLYGAQFVIFVTTALIVVLPAALVNAAILRHGGLGLVPVTVLLTLVADALYTGAVVEAVRDMRDGRRDFGVAQLLSAAGPFVFPLALASVVFVIGALISVIAFIVGTFVFITFFCLFAPAIVVERQGIFGSLGRSADLVQGNAWRVFGVVVVVGIVSGVAQSLLTNLGTDVSDSYGGRLVGNLIGSVLTAPLFALAASVLYFQLRDIREGTQGLSAPAPPPQV